MPKTGQAGAIERFKFVNGDFTGNGKYQNPISELEGLLKRINYSPLLRALPRRWLESRDGVSYEQARKSLGTHAEKKALAWLVSQDDPAPHVEVNTPSCEDCQAFFEAVANDLGVKVTLQDSRHTYSFGPQDLDESAPDPMQRNMTANEKQQIKMRVFKGSRGPRLMSKHLEKVKSPDKEI